MSKISVIGAGAVGATAAYALVERSIVDEVVIVDINQNRATGVALDIAHGISFLKPVNVHAGTYSDTADSDIIVITVGVPEIMGESRLIPVQKNTDILKDIIPQLLKYSPKAVLIVVSNPVDILTYITAKISKLPQGQVIGLGTSLDTSRFKLLLSQKFKINTGAISGYMIGEHGDSQIAAWSKTHIAGISIEEYSKLAGIPISENFKSEIEKEVKQTAFDVWEMKGPNCYCVADAIRSLSEAILRNEYAIMPVSSPFNGEHGIYDVSLSLPSIIARGGVQKILPISLSKEELEGLKNSASIMKSIIDQIKL